MINGLVNDIHAWNGSSKKPQTLKLKCAIPTPTGIDSRPCTPPATPREACNEGAIPDNLLLPNGYPDYIRLITTSKVYDVLQQTPLTHAAILSNQLNSTILLKREDLSPVFSFKLRGAYNKMAHLSEEESWKGVVACSAGNHAQGVAFSAKKLRIPSTIIMPIGTPSIKHENVSRLGGHTVLYGADFDEAKLECSRRAGKDGLAEIPPFDDPYVIAGQGTIGAEILQQVCVEKLEAVFCAVGGGGLIAGVGVYIKRFAPHVKIIGVEPYHANALYQSLKLGHRVKLNQVDVFADGVAVKAIGEETFRLCQEVVDEVIQVNTDDICMAIKDVFNDTRCVLEPAGAVSLAGLKKHVAASVVDYNRHFVAVASGANMDFDRLRFVTERVVVCDKENS